MDINATSSAEQATNITIQKLFQCLLMHSRELKDDDDVEEGM